MRKSPIKQIYYYVVCLVSLVILLWGVVDVLSSTVSLIAFKPSMTSYEPMPSGEGLPGGDIKGVEPSIEDFYQKRMVLDRVGDSFARILVSGLVFGYFSLKLKGLEKEE